MRVKVYFNITKRLFSVVALDGPSKGLVVQSVTNLVLQNCRFHVNESGRQRVLAQNRKNVHAYVYGEIDSSLLLPGQPVVGGIEITYNPYKYSTFVIRETGLPIDSADYLQLLVIDGWPVMRALVRSYTEPVEPASQIIGPAAYSQDEQALMSMGLSPYDTGLLPR